MHSPVLRDPQLVDETVADTTVFIPYITCVRDMSFAVNSFFFGVILFPSTPQPYNIHNFLRWFVERATRFFGKRFSYGWSLSPTQDSYGPQGFMGLPGSRFALGYIATKLVA